MLAYLVYIAVAAAILSSAFGVGVFLDKYTAKDTQERLWDNLSKADRIKWSAAAINIVVIAYESIFPGRLGSFRFFLRSFIAYFILIVAFLLFLAIFFPFLFYSCLSAYTDGDAKDAITTTALVLLGAPIFWAANAQTLYFMRLAQRDPRPTPIVLILYADTLLTASICVFGVGLLLWLQTIVSLQQGSHRVQFQIFVEPASRSLVRSLESAQSARPHAHARILEMAIRDNASRPQQASALVAQALPSARATGLAQRDVDLIAELFPLSGIPIVRVDQDTVQFLDGQGEVVDFQSVSVSLGSGWGRTFESDASQAAICRQLLDPRMPGNGHYVHIHRVAIDSRWTLEACQRGETGNISATVSLNRNNIDYSRLASLQFKFVFEHLVMSVTSGFRTYAAIYPLHFLNRSWRETAWVHNHVISEGDRAGFIRADNMLLDGYLAEEGVRAVILNRTLPAGTIISAIMATSIFTWILILSATGAIGLASSARALVWMDGPFLIRGHPFVFVMLAVGGAVCVVAWLLL